ncbi:hypothetical protein [Algoriphagus zhangzhouensis]|uniref:Uncharacterized protein n=1 Tax=Algoriphagus zhangzhouensis TaxID=1073327 RepID=A0A1M7ZD45_9BACT|nr:hypothetical protein [Algoriphagus zhangzhouensis]TDY45734.1 hypothetical protein A8938_2338 [Algoriphagus zhangzhouensis]SHO62818.1 hypothetical protein SAMN04488108_2335 [Algoriphagus zhangzhouensis]
MRNLLSGFLIITIGLVLFSFVNNQNTSIQGDIPEKEWMIAPRFLKLQDGISKKEAREWLEQEYLPLYRAYPGFNCQAGEPWRSGGWGTTDNTLKSKADFVLIYSFDNKTTFDRYFPEDGGGFDAVAEESAKHMSIVEEVFFGKYFIKDEYQIEEYLMFASSK